MADRISRRKLIGVGGAAALVPVVATGGRAQAIPLPPYITLPEPVRLHDSRTSGGKLATGSSVTVSLADLPEHPTFGELHPTGVFVNITIADTEGRGFLTIRASEPEGTTKPLTTSNVNWSSDGQVVANLAVVPVGEDESIVVHASGDGRTNFIVDLQAVVPSYVV